MGKAANAGVLFGILGAVNASASNFEELPSLAWTRTLPGGSVGGLFHTERAPAKVHGDQVYLGSAGGNALYVLNARTGVLAHQYEAAAPVFAEPVFWDDAVFFSDSAGYTYRYEIGSEQPTWAHFSGVPINSAPTVSEGQVLIATVEDLVFSVDGTTGDTLWRYQHPPDATRESELTLFGAPQPIVVAESVLFGFSDGNLVQLDRATGDFQWQKQVGQGRYPDLIASPVVSDNTAFLGAFSEPFLAMDLDTQTPRWSLEFGTANEPVVSGGTVYVPGSDGVLRALDKVTGEQSWSWQSDTTGALTSPILTPAGLVVASSDGGLYWVSPSTGKLVWSYNPGHILGGVSAQPSYSGDTLLVVTNGARLLAFQNPKKQEPPAAWKHWEFF